MGRVRGPGANATAGHRGEVVMAAQVANHAPARARRSAAFVGDPILISKVQVTGRPGVDGSRVPGSPSGSARARGGGRSTVVAEGAGGGQDHGRGPVGGGGNWPVLAWVGLDQVGDEPDTFWRYVLAALRRAGAALPEELRARPAGAGS